MDYLERNLGTLSLLAFALAALLTELAGALDTGIGASVAKVALVCLAAGRGFVLAAQALSPNHDSNA